MRMQPKVLEGARNHTFSDSFPEGLREGEVAMQQATRASTVDAVAARGLRALRRRAPSWLGRAIGPIMRQRLDAAPERASLHSWRNPPSGVSAMHIRRQSVTLILIAATLCASVLTSAV